ncbi:MAG: YfiR family protein [Hahellaceae bacterium]|nr:YfiR family protein [Hahellaceae bacterium]
MYKCRGAWSRAGRRVAAALTFTLLSFAVWSAPPRSEYEVKAVYLFNFTKFVTWPVAQPDAALQLCLIGLDPFDGRLSTLAGKRVQGRELQFSVITTESQAAKCQLVFVSKSEARRFAPLLDGLRGYPVLTVSDIPEFENNGGMIGLHSEGNLIRFSVNLKQVRGEGLDVNSRLLELAAEVIQ